MASQVAGRVGELSAEMLDHSDELFAMSRGLVSAFDSRRGFAVAASAVEEAAKGIATGPVEALTSGLTPAIESLAARATASAGAIDRAIAAMDAARAAGEGRRVAAAHSGRERMDAVRADCQLVREQVERHMCKGVASILATSGLVEQGAVSSELLQRVRAGVEADRRQQEGSADGPTATAARDLGAAGGGVAEGEDEEEDSSSDDE